jgi:hypothetical protein
MNVGHIILGRSWLYNLDVTIFGRSNSCSFIFHGKQIQFIGYHQGLMMVVRRKKSERMRA